MGDTPREWRVLAQRFADMQAEIDEIMNPSEGDKNMVQVQDSKADRLDHELKALLKCGELLAQFDEATQARMLQFLVSAFVPGGSIVRPGKVPRRGAGN